MWGPGHARAGQSTGTWARRPTLRTAGNTSHEGGQRSLEQRQDVRADRRRLQRFCRRQGEAGYRPGKLSVPRGDVPDQLGEVRQQRRQLSQPRRATCRCRDDGLLGAKDSSGLPRQRDRAGRLLRRGPHRVAGGRATPARQRRPHHPARPRGFVDLRRARRPASFEVWHRHVLQLGRHNPGTAGICVRHRGRATHHHRGAERLHDRQEPSRHGPNARGS